MKNNLHERIHKIIQGVHWSPNSGIWFSDSVIDEILQTVYKEIEKKLNKNKKEELPDCYCEKCLNNGNWNYCIGKCLDNIKQVLEVEG